jgi:soluble lytic murein transglycosylase-like protein
VSTIVDAPAEPAAAVPTLRLSASWPASIQQWAPLLEKWGTQYAIDPDLLAAVVQMESGGNPGAVSHSGACGLMQVMARDTTGAYGRMFAARPTCQELQDPERNISWAVHYLATLYQRNGADWRQALYHYGPVDACWRYTSGRSERVAG